MEHPTVGILKKTRPKKFREIRCPGGGYWEGQDPKHKDLYTISRKYAHSMILQG